MTVFRILLLLFLLHLTFSLFAQEDLTVILTNYLTNEPVAGVEVVLENKARGISRTVFSNERGRTVFRALPEVEGYFLRVEENDEFLEAEAGPLDIRSKEAVSVDLFLFERKAVDLQEAVVRAEATTQINRTDAEVSFELKQKEIQRLPVEGRDITRVLFRLPNVSQATGFYPEAPNVSINGANPLFTSYLIDGLDNNERFLGGQKFAIPVGFTRNVNVLTNNYSAEYGLTANGVVNITTRSGGNDFSGEAYFINRPGPALDGQPNRPQRDLSGNPVLNGFSRYQAGFGVGGPIVKDQTFFYLNYEHTTDLKDNALISPDLGVSETIAGTNTFNYLSSKIDHRWSDRFRSSLRANVGLTAIERQGGGLEGGVLFPSAGSIQDRNAIIIASKNSYVGERFSIETNLQYARFRWNYARPLMQPGPQVTLLNPSEETIGIIGSPDFTFDQTENSLQLQQRFRYYLGQHTLKAGFNIIRSEHQLFGGGNPDGNYRVKLTEAQLQQLRSLGRGAGLNVNDIPTDVEVLGYNVELRPSSINGRQTVYSAFIEDRWSAGERLNFTLGLRYDYDNLSKGGGAEGDLDNFAPRFNFNYKLSPRSALRGGYGIFYDKIPYAVYSDALQQSTTSADYRAQLQELVDQGLLPADSNLDAITFKGNLSAFSSNVDYLQGPTSEDLAGQREEVFSNERRILNPAGYDNPYSHQFTLGYQLQINEQTLFYLDLVHNQSYDLLRLRNLNAAVPYPLPNPATAAARTPAAADSTRPVPIYEGSYAIIDGEQRTGVARNVVVSETEGRSRYYGASFNYQKERGEDDYALRINYTLSYLENNTEDINFRAMDANDFESEWGPSINDRRHILNGIFSYFPADRLSITVAALLQSGQPINRIPDAEEFGTTDLNGDGVSFGDAYLGNSDRYPGEPRNSDRLPWSQTFDLGLHYHLPLGAGRMELRADIFNVFNAENLSGYSNNATQSNQIQVGPVSSGLLVRRNFGPPRQFQFGLRYAW